MAEASQISVLLRLRDQASGPLKTFGDKVEQHRRKIGGAMLAMGGAITGFAALSLKTASDVEEMQAKFDTVFGKMAASTEQWATETGIHVGRSRLRLMGYATSVQDIFVPAMKASGLAEDEAREAAAKMSQQVTKLAVDLGSFNNMATPEVVRKLTSAFVGNWESVRSLGITLNQTMIEDALLEKGIISTRKEMTLAQKVQEVYNQLMEQSADAIDDAHRTIEGFANQLAKTGDEMYELKNTVGTALLPIGTQALKSISPFLEGLRKWMELNPELAATIIKVTTVIGLLLIPIGALALAGVAVSLAWSPVTLVILALAAAVAGIIIVFKNWDAIVADIKMSVIDMWVPLKKLGLGISELRLKLMEWTGADKERIKVQEKAIQTTKDELQLLKLQKMTHAETIRARREKNQEMRQSIAETASVLTSATSQNVDSYETTGAAAVESAGEQIAANGDVQTAVKQTTQTLQEEHKKAIQAQKERSQEEQFWMWERIRVSGIAAEKMIEDMNAKKEAEATYTKFWGDYKRQQIELQLEEYRVGVQVRADKDADREKDLDRLRHNLDETVVAWNDSNSRMEDVVKAWAQVNKMSVDEVIDRWAELQLDTNDLHMVMAAFTKETGQDFFDWAEKIKAAAGSVDGLANSMAGLRDSSKINFTQAGVEAYKTDPRFMGREGEFTEQIRSRIPQFKNMSQDKLESVEGQLQARLSDQYENLKNFKTPEKFPAEWAFLKNVQTPDIENSIALFDQLMNARRKGTMDSFANGGVSRGGLALVGERGPEVVSLPGGSRVHPNGAGGGSNTFIFNGAVYGVEDLREVIVEAVRDHAISGGFSGVFGG